MQRFDEGRSTRRCKSCWAEFGTPAVKEVLEANGMGYKSLRYVECCPHCGEEL